MPLESDNATNDDDQANSSAEVGTGGISSFSFDKTQEEVEAVLAQREADNTAEAAGLVKLWHIS